MTRILMLKAKRDVNKETCVESTSEVSFISFQHEFLVGAYFVAYTVVCLKAVLT